MHSFVIIQIQCNRQYVQYITVQKVWLVHNSTVHIDTIFVYRALEQNTSVQDRKCGQYITVQDLRIAQYSAGHIDSTVQYKICCLYITFQDTGLGIVHYYNIIILL